MSLFIKKDIILFSGQRSDFKIECDDLTYSDVETLCYLISKKIRFFSVYGVPTGGFKFAEGLKTYRTFNTNLPTLIVDDVWTTGASMRSFIKEHEVVKPVGVVIFARGKCPPWVHPIFQMW